MEEEEERGEDGGVGNVHGGWGKKSVVENLAVGEKKVVNESIFVARTEFRASL